MIKIHDKIYVGRLQVLNILKRTEWALLGTTQTYHYKLMGWKKGFNYRDNPQYLIYEEDGMMSINWVDADARYFDWQGEGVETFIKALDFIQKQNKQVYIFCDQGISRSPSVALLYLSKRLKVISNESFEKARQDFLLLYPIYDPGGIKDFISNHWEEIK